MAFISYTPGGSSTLTKSTVGPTTGVSKVGQLAPIALGVLPAAPTQVYPAYGRTGTPADAGDVADCLNQLVARIEQLEALLAINPVYGITQT